MYQMTGEKPLRAERTSKKLQLLTTPWLSVEGEWSHHCVNFASSYKMGNVYSCAVIWLLIAFFFQPQALVDPVGALGEANLSEATMSFLFGALTICQNWPVGSASLQIILVSCEELRAVSVQSHPALGGWPFGSQTAHSVGKNWSLLSAN